MLTTIILAGGKGTRMKSDLPKVIHKLNGRALIDWVVDLAKGVESDQTIVVVGYKKDLVIEQVGNECQFAVQEEQLGTGHAVSVATELIAPNTATVLVLNGDMPLLDPNDIKDQLKLHKERKAAATLLTAEVPNPFGYGRIIRDKNDHVEKIVEEKDASDKEKTIKEVCTGTYCFDKKLLFDYLKEINNNNSQKEYYLTDLIQILNKAGEKVVAYKAKDWKTAVGTNTIEELELAEKILQEY